MNEWSWVLSHVIAFKTYVSASMTSLAIFLEIVSVSAPSFCRLFHFQPQLTQKLFLQITYTPLPSVHFLYTYYISTLKKSSQTKPALWRFFFFFLKIFESEPHAGKWDWWLWWKGWWWPVTALLDIEFLLHLKCAVPFLSVHHIHSFISVLCMAYLISGLLCQSKTYKHSFKT